jgi:CRISPR-associated protein Cmr4
MKQTILGLKAQTSIHAGTGQNNGVIDLPIQREVHTGYPCVFGSAVKGAFRAHAEIRAGWDKKGKVQDVFGKEDASANSAISMTDARLLLLPVRSLTGHFKLVTCPAILKRLKSDMQMMGMQASWDDVKVNSQKDSLKILGNGKGDIFLEEFKFTFSGDVPADVIDALESFGAEALKEQLIVMSDDDFGWFAKNATAITPHIAIDNDTKTVKGGALWYEESLPSETLMYTMLMGNDAEVDAVTGMFSGDKPFIQIGGNETVGMGWCKVQEVAA